MYTATILSVLFSLTTAQYPAYVAPGADDVRCPCPALNTLANHGFIPHDGKNMTLPILIAGLKNGMNVGADFATVIGSLGLMSVPDNLLATSFDLNQLDEHNFPIEHDASLSRADYYLNNGDNYSFNQTNFDQVLAFYEGMNETSIPVAAKAKYARVQTELARDPKITYGALQFVLSYGETALYLSVFGNPTTGVGPVEYVKTFFEEERLPYDEVSAIMIYGMVQYLRLLQGWTPPTEETNLTTLLLMILQLVPDSGEPIPEGLTITEQTLKQAFGGYDPITGILRHAL
ncbi:putative sterigmatocystin biosynthesis peroxidase [Lachnellula suecica]|uniref:Putative sterigmatocystin biosynthesis peroxidase n=1 Tax=Lachnellula suecica TaxID=602035 RepID=A0A8T9C0U1_9HELO|nr:putative sterigmatocystin biosynthesis peroxidase [Lachnellula suecica]